MDEFLNQLNMFFHPSMDINKKHLNEEKMIQRNHIKLLTYNIFIRPPPVKNNENDWKDERLADFIKLLEYYDIICLQEMFGSFSNRKQELIKYANKSGLFFFVDSPSPSFFSKFLVDGGLLILSRFPIIESEFRPFRYSVLSDSLANKGILYAKIKVKDSSVMVFNTHTQASYFGSSSYHWNISVQTRIDQLDELCYFIKEVLDSTIINSETILILTGDLNVDAHNYHKKREKTKLDYEAEDEYQILLEKLNKIVNPIDIFKTAFEFSPFTFGYNGDNLKHYDRILTAKEDIGSFQTLDYIFELKLKRKNLDSEIYSEHKKSIKEDKLMDKYDSSSEIVINIDTNKSQLNKGNKKKLCVDYSSAQVENFLISDKPYQQLSDHFGLSVDLKFHESKQDV